MILLTNILILLTLSGISIADNVCETKECKQTADLISSSVDNQTDPCDNFYEYSCGTWIKNHPLETSADMMQGKGHFQELTIQMNTDLMNLLEKSSVEKDPKYVHPLINYYKGCVNTKTRDSQEKRDFDLIRGVLKQIGGWPLIDPEWNENDFDIEKSLIELNKIFPAKSILNIEVTNDLRNKSNTIISITNPFSGSELNEGIYRIPGQKKVNIFDGISESSEFYGSENENKIQMIAEALMGSKIDSEKFNIDMTATQELTFSLQSISTPINTIDYILKNYDSLKISVKELDQFSALNYRKIINEIFKSEGIEVKDNDVVFADKEYLKNLESILKDAKKRTLANLLSTNMAYIMSRFTTIKMFELSGLPSVELLPQICLQFATQIIPDMLGRHYRDHLFLKESEADMKEFIVSIKEAFNGLLAENQWMDEKTKELAVKKLDAISQHIAFPDYLTNDKQLEDYYKQYANFSEDSFMSAMITSFSHQRSENLRALRHPDPEGHWPAPAHAVMINAFYNPEVNGIFFPAGIAQFPFYQHSRPMTLNLGAIGMAISHELTHAFDNLGSLFDEKGNLHNWISDKSKEVFNEKAKCFVDQYNKFEYDVGFGEKMKLNGLRTLGENIADNGGVRIAYRAMELYKKNNPEKIQKLPGILEEFSDEKLFFMSFANVWCSHMGSQGIKARLQDVHSIDDARVIASMSNFPEFAKAFNCKAGSKMSPTERCVLWG